MLFDKGTSPLPSTARRSLLTTTALGLGALSLAGCTTISGLFNSSGGLSTATQAAIQAAQAAIAAIQGAISKFVAGAGSAISASAQATITQVDGYVTDVQNMITAAVSALSNSAFNPSQVGSWLDLAIQLLSSLLAVVGRLGTAATSAFQPAWANADNAVKRFHQVVGT